MRVFLDVAGAIRDPYLRRAFALAELGRGTTSPNPVVGCVIVRDGKIAGEGFHESAGREHAEVVALRAAGERASGSVAYVTLEPCNHVGRTGPCVPALVEAGVGRVVIGMRDPDPGVAGGGVEALRAAGVAVDLAADPTPFREQNEAWLSWLATGRPWVRVKVALSLDGRPALRAGRRASISGTGGAGLTARLRAEADAVLVGAATAMIDDPALTVRDASGGPSGPRPLRIVLARRTVPPPTLRVFSDGAAPSMLLTATDADVAGLVDAGVRVEEYDAQGGLISAIAHLGTIGVVSLLVEAGGRLLKAFSDADLVDEMVVVHAGGFAGLDAPALWDGTADGVDDALVARFRATEASVVGDDAATVWRPIRAAGHGCSLGKGSAACSPV